MSRCPTLTFKVSIMSKWLTKHISTKVSLKITIRKRHVYIDIRCPWKWNQYFYFGIRNDERTKINIFAFISARYTIKFTEEKWNNFINELWHINLNMNVFISNSYNSSFYSTKLKFFTLFQFFTRLLNSYHFNYMSTQLVGRKGVMWNTCFSASQNAKNESHLKHKIQVRNRFFLTVRSSSMKDYTCHYVVST